MFFTVVSIVLAVVIVAASVIAIVMSTSHGTGWIQSVWESREDKNRGAD